MSLAMNNTEVFSNRRPREEKAGDEMAAELYQLKKISVIYF